MTLHKIAQKSPNNWATLMRKFGHITCPDYSITLGEPHNDCFEHGVQLSGEEMMEPVVTSSADICQRICLTKLDNCSHFTFNLDNSTCTLLSDVFSLSDNPNFISGVKICKGKLVLPRIL